MLVFTLTQVKNLSNNFYFIFVQDMVFWCQQKWTVCIHGIKSDPGKTVFISADVTGENYVFQLERLNRVIYTKRYILPKGPIFGKNRALFR